MPVTSHFALKGHLQAWDFIWTGTYMAPQQFPHDFEDLNIAGYRSKNMTASFRLNCCTFSDSRLLKTVLQKSNPLAAWWHSVLHNQRKRTENGSDPRKPMDVAIHRTPMIYHITMNGGFHSHGGTPKIWLVYVRENPPKKNR